jgi:xanthosine utilization system XapX-like protein
MRPMRPLLALLAVLTIVGLTGSPLAGQSVALQYHWNKGDHLRYRVTQESAVTMSGIPGMDGMTITTTTTQVQQLTANDVASDGTATINALFESVRMDMVSPMGNMTYDSTAPPAANADPTLAQVAGILGAMVGESITVVIGRNGAVRSVEGASRLMDKVKGQMPQATGALNPLGDLNSMMSDDAMRGAFGQSFANLPDGPVKTGDTWQSEIKMPNPAGTLTMASTFTMKGVEKLDGRDVTRIGYAQHISAGPDGGLVGPMTVHVGNGTGEGEMIFDHAHGRIISTTGQSTLPMSMSMTGPDGSSINLDASTLTKIKMELIER